MLNKYLKQLHKIYQRGDAREESYYSTLEKLLYDYTESTKKKNVHITPLPKKTEAGNPDFRVWDGKQKIVGYIEAKSPTTKHLDQIKASEQIKRYLSIFPNLILTNFFEFRLYRDGNLINSVQIARPYHIEKLKSVPPVEKETEFLNLLERYFAFSLPKVYTAKNLAVELAKRTRFLRDEVIAQELEEEEKRKKGFIIGFYHAFQKYLISSITKAEFADLYSQTITYGLFAARTRTEKYFSRRIAYDYIPPTIGILRDVFKFISLEDLPKQMEWIIDDISEILAVTDVHNILHKYFHEGKGRDPIVHFYETFLSEYDPKTREKRGVYYTPEPVVSYIVRSLHSILKKRFNKPDGFAEDSVTVLDPAAGTLTFLTETAKLAIKEFTAKYGDGGKENFTKEHILKNYYAFELMMAPYAIGHLKMSFLLEELGYKLRKDDRFKLYLTNTLEMEELEQTDLPGMASLSEESHLAGKVKKEQPILVILGNPPYSGHSSNVGEWISKEIKAYYEVDGKPLGEKNPKWLQDDYVKFIRFAQWKIDKAGEGVIGLITNHSYLDNPTFRGMRQSLMNSFNEIYILNLHGSSLKKEKCPDGSEDKNVFDIKQGVAIVLFIKKKGKKKKCKIFHSDLWGMRNNKYDWLSENYVDTTKWQEIKPKSEFYLFIPRDEELSNKYEKYLKITDIFPVNSVGIVTSRDRFVINPDKETIKRRIRMFIDKKIPDEIIKQTYKLKDTVKKNKDGTEKIIWDVKGSRAKVINDTEWESTITRILYRPFDIQWIFYSDAVIERSRKNIMRHMMQENLGLIVPRQVKLDFHHSYCTTHIINFNALDTAGSFGSGFLFPLYLYKQKENLKKRSFGSAMMLFEEQEEYGNRRPNLAPELVRRLTEEYMKSPDPENIFFYIYGVLYSNTYRTKYAEFLKIDFPRVPFTKDYKLFIKMGRQGKRLVDLHLMKSKELDKPIAKFQSKGNNKVEKLRYEEDSNQLFINKDQYFDGITPEIWQYQIGGYQVCDKWLKDRKGKSLFAADIKHYCRIVTVLKETIDIQKKIDKIYPDVEDKIIEVQPP